MIDCKKGTKMTKRHKHADLIHAWAEGAFIQISLNGILVDCFDSPDCSFNSSYRVKPAKKNNQI